MDSQTIVPPNCPPWMTTTENLQQITIHSYPAQKYQERNMKKTGKTARGKLILATPNSALKRLKVYRFYRDDPSTPSPDLCTGYTHAMFIEDCKKGVISGTTDLQSVPVAGTVNFGMSYSLSVEHALFQGVVANKKNAFRVGILELEVRDFEEGDVAVVQDDNDERHILLRPVTSCSRDDFEKMMFGGCLVGKGRRGGLWDFDPEKNVLTRVV